MKANRIEFQMKALKELRAKVAQALGEYHTYRTPQVVSYTAPTGAGKTIVMSYLLESIYCGDELYEEQPNAIIIWLSDSPELNQQSKDKIDCKADRILPSQTVMIKDESFDAEILEDGKIYFLNTQKLGRNSNLVKHGDSRQYTIWETLTNTVREKSDRLYVIIDEAHRGMQGNEAARATSIMQKFLKGSEQDGLPKMPVVIGMSATSERFNNLVAGLGSTTIRSVVTTADEVRMSGLLKDRITIVYPDTVNNDMAMLQAAADEWKDKWLHWDQYCREQHYKYVNPVFVIQVLNGHGDEISETDLNTCLQKIQERTGMTFSRGEVVHTFGQTSATLTINGLEVDYIEPSAIADNRNIKIVFFKENLSTGWDCPRAETMMSFRHANDATYIAQLLGRMVRTPLQMRIIVDDSLNEVRLFLPYFNQTNVSRVVDALISSEGATIPTDVKGEELGDDTGGYWTVKPTKTITTPSVQTNQQTNDERKANHVDLLPTDTTATTSNIPDAKNNSQTSVQDTGEEQAEGQEMSEYDGEEPYNNNEVSIDNSGEIETEEIETDGIDRSAILKVVNEMGLLTYTVRNIKINNYLQSMFDLAELLSRTSIERGLDRVIKDEIVGMIHSHIVSLKENGTYDELVQKVKQFKLSTATFDVFGNSTSEVTQLNLFTTTDEDLDRQFRAAENKLAAAGVANRYGDKYYSIFDPNGYMVDVIIFVHDSTCMAKLDDYAKHKFHEMVRKYRLKVNALDEKNKKHYNDIVTNGDEVSEHSLTLPESVSSFYDPDGDVYTNHLYVSNKTGEAKIKLNTWERGVLLEEMSQPTFVCWLRNIPRASWALAIPYEKANNMKPTYPDILAVHRSADGQYYLNLLEPHDPSRDDNLAKAKGFARYAEANPGLGSIQLIRKGKTVSGERFIRLDMTNGYIREMVKNAITNDELSHIFDTEGYSYD